MNIRDHILKAINDGLTAQREVIDGKPGVRFFGVDEPKEGSFILFENLGYNSTFGYFDKTQFSGQSSDCTNENPEELYVGLFTEGWRPLIWFDDGGNPNMLGDVWQAADVYQMLKDYFEKGVIHGEVDEEECESGGMQWLQVADAAYFAHRTNEQRFPDPADAQLGNSIRVAAERGSIRTRAGESGKLYYHRESVEDWARKDEQRGRPRTRTVEPVPVQPKPAKDPKDNRVKVKAGQYQVGNMLEGRTIAGFGKVWSEATLSGGQLWQECDQGDCDREPVCVHCFRCDKHCHCDTVEYCYAYFS